MPGGNSLPVVRADLPAAPRTGQSGEGQANQRQGARLRNCRPVEGNGIDGEIVGTLDSHRANPVGARKDVGDGIGIPETAEIDELNVHEVEEDVEESVIESHVSKMRKKLRQRVGYDVIDSKRYIGYCIAEPKTAYVSRAQAFASEFVDARQDAAEPAMA